MMDALRARGIPASVPLAYGERRWCGVLLTKALLLRKLQCLSFQAYIKRHYSGTLSKVKILQKRALLRKLADFIRHVHEKILTTGLSRGNILVTEADSGEPVFILLTFTRQGFAIDCLASQD